MSDGFRQEVLNVALAGLLHERGLVAAPENIIKGASGKRKLPDVIVIYRGLRIIIEGEVDDQPKAREKALEAARRRVRDGLAHIGMAVIYPQKIRHTAFPDLKTEMAASELQVAFVTEAGESHYANYSVKDFESILRHTFEQLIQEDVVASAVAKLDAGIEKFAAAVSGKEGLIKRMADALGIQEISAEKLGSISRIGGLVLINAMIFQEVLSDHDGRVQALESIHENPIHLFSTHWQFIINEINYFPIFNIAREIITGMSANADFVAALHGLKNIAQQLIENRAALHRDLMGRVYHRLLADAKYLGTYYTTIPAAALLLKLALSSENSWHDLKKLQRIKVADLSCGTGTLLMAAADAIADNYVSSSVKKGQDIDFTGLHKVLYENVLHGYDVLPSAIHLTASTLALRAPKIAFKKMNLYSLPLGGQFLRLGSIEFINGSTIQAQDLFGAAPTTQQMTGTGIEEVDVASMPLLDLCVMNPPFTRSVGGNLLFGSAPEEERTKMQKRLQQMVKQRHVKANTTAGLGSIFVATGHRYIKEDGHIALVLPKALLSGVAWAKTRELINENYQLEYIIASHDAERWNFSESTDLSEVLLIARKNNGDRTKNHKNKVTAVNLWRNPATAFDALAIAHVLLRDTPPDLIAEQGALPLMLDKLKVGEAIYLDQDAAKQNWLFPCAFAQSDLTRVAYHLQNGDVWLPGYGKVGSLPLAPLKDFGVLGPDRRDIHDGFDVTEHVTPFPSFWGRDARSMKTMSQEANAYLAPLAQAKQSRSLRKVEDLWPLAGTVLIAEKLRMNTQQLLAVRMNKQVLSNVWWTFALKEQATQEAFEKALVLWFNSSFGMLLLLVNREETQGTWLGFKKPNVNDLPVLDLSKLTPEQLQILSATYDSIASKELLPFPQMDTDPVRAEIDKAIVTAFHLPDVSILRTLLGREPVVCMKRI